MKKIPIYLVPFLWVGFAIRARRFAGYRKWRQERLHLAANLFPPSEQWFSPLLKRWIGLRFWLATGHREKWVLEVFSELCEETAFLYEFKPVKGVGDVLIQPGFIQIKRPDGYWFTINETWPGCVYVHYAKDPKDGEADWKMAYRVGWEVSDTRFINTMEKLWKMIKNANRRLDPIKSA